MTLDADKKCKSVADYEADFDALKSQAGSTIVRTYSVLDVNVPEYPCDVAATILPAVQAKNFKVILGLWYVSPCGSKCQHVTTRLTVIVPTGLIRKHPSTLKRQPYSLS